MLMGEFKLENKEKASMVIELMDLMEDDELDYPLSYYIDAAKDFSTMEDAERGLIKECPICTLSYPVHEASLSLSLSLTSPHSELLSLPPSLPQMIIMPGCTDTMCKECFKGHFRVTITEKGVKHFNCPSCDQPDMTNRDDAQDLYQELFVHLVS